MTPAALMLRLKRRAAQAGIAACSPHDLRRTELLDAGAGNAPAAAAASSTRC